MNSKYVHGYNHRENKRMQDQAQTLAELLLSDTSYPDGSLVLEAGCGIGSQTVKLAKNSPGAQIISVDISEESLRQAQESISARGITNVKFQQGDIFNLQFEEKTFDHIFICFVLEHLPNPVEALGCLKKLIKPGGSITVIEGDHGSTYFYPDCDDTHKAITCLVELQKQAGGDALIGRRLYPLLTEANFSDCRVLPRMVYVDSSRPDLVEGFTKNTFTAMIEGIREKALQSGLIDQGTFDNGIKGLNRTTQPDGVFCYTFFKAAAQASSE